MYKLLAIDIDGTIVSGYSGISQRTKHTLKRAYESGVHVVISTARPYCSAMDIIRELGLPQIPVICFAGAVLQMYPSGEIISCDTFLPEQIREIAAYCESVGQHLQVYRTDGSYYFMHKNFISDTYAEYFGYFGEETDLLQWDHSDACRTMLIAPREPAAVQEKIYKNMRDSLEEHYAISCSWPGFYDIQPKFSNKGRTLSILARSMNIKREEIIAFGDQTVDQTMLNYAGIGVAMGNGDDALKKVADIIAPPCLEDGVAKVVDQLIFGE